ncbi:phospholipid carrier-dependent glycosyltransferase [Croceicoccus sediminis]|uniref:phospholipid carrier-dependent glycosyltransferase n=1 Tax=Croceicoccus sediminis TaxID=2571150 RepID=UPI0011830E2E|nr:phospholipid carrier-dependent glycosyltransferase [Croceicoccus sediminis]
MQPVATTIPRERDPLGWMLLITLIFAGLALWGLAEVAIPIFDETHYLPASRAWVAGEILLNPEHPVLGKQMIALSIQMLGDNPGGWRAGSVLFGVLTLFAVMRMTWLASGSRFAALAAGVLVSTNFLLLVQSRVAMLDIYMLGFLMLGCWSLVAAGTGRHVRARVILAGLLFGLSLAVKWNAAPVIAFAGLCVFIGNLRAKFTGARRPLGDMTIVEAFVWLGLLPVAVYLASFTTIWLLDSPNPRFTGPVSWQGYMLDLQESVKKDHPYMSRWWQWVIDWRPIWYFYEEYEGAWRGMLFLGNPLTMLTGLAALAGCLWLGLVRGRMDCLMAVGAWGAALALWIAAPKPVQFYYHYLISAQFLMVALALAVDHWVWRNPPWRLHRRAAPAFLAASTLFFVYFLPILTTQPLAGKNSFVEYAWFTNWR